MSPERIVPEQFGFKNGHPTIPSDCYALGMVIYETISGNLPFHEYTDFQAYMKIVKGEQPHRGVRFTDDLWKMLEQCWMIQPGNRPSVEDVLRCLETDLKSPEPPSLVANEEIEDCDASSSTNGVPSGIGGTIMTKSTIITMSADSNNGGFHRVSTIQFHKLLIPT